MGGGKERGRERRGVKVDGGREKEVIKRGVMGSLYSFVRKNV